MKKNRLTFVMAWCCVFGFAPIPLRAGADFQDIALLEVLDGGATAQGTHRAALKVELADGWKTYWRVPGRSGIPPRITWDTSVDVGHVTVTWPAPSVFDEGPERTFGYKHQMVLPLEITGVTPGKHIRLKGEISIGLCKDVCVPFVFDFDQVLDAQSPANAIIAAAMAARPYTMDEAQIKDVSCQLDSSGDEDNVLVVVVNMPSAGGPEVVVLEPKNPQLWVAHTTVKRTGNLLNISSEIGHVSGAQFALDQSHLRITVLGQNYAVDIPGCG